MGIGVFPNVGSSVEDQWWPLCGVRIINSFNNRKLVSTISILSRTPLVKAGNGEPIADAARMKTLQRYWDEDHAEALRDYPTLTMVLADKRKILSRSVED